MQAVGRIVRLLPLKHQRMGRRGFASGYDTLPQPQGNWKAHYDAQQRKYNRDLVLGIITITGTLAFGYQYDLMEAFSDIPDRPADIASYK